MKPKYLFHGSQYKFDIVKPKQACGETPSDSLMAIYAYESFKDVIPFALPIRWYPDKPGGKRAFTSESGKTYIEYGSINPYGIGYVYKLKSDYFYKIDNGQWVSNTDVLPDEIYEISVKTYLNTITFSPEASKIMFELYGDIQLGFDTTHNNMFPDTPSPTEAPTALADPKGTPA